MTQPDRIPELWELWARPSRPSPRHLENWTLPRLIREAAEQRTIPDEEVATWPAVNHPITLADLLAESRRLEESHHA